MKGGMDTVAQVLLCGRVIYDSLEGIAHDFWGCALDAIFVDGLDGLIDIVWMDCGHCEIGVVVILVYYIVYISIAIRQVAMIYVP